MKIRDIFKAPALRLLGYRPQRVSADAWDREYRDGRWSFLESMGCVAGTAAIMGYVQFLAPASILDVGCGAGILANKLKVLPYRSFLGIDLSPEAVAQADAAADARTTFAAADAETFETDRRFDVIIFNQCMYYMRDPRATIAHYARFLSPNGRIIVAMADNARATVAWPLIARDMVVEDWTTHEQAEGRGTVKVLRRG
jgi:2-polyprenyl-3-methyl-5-hydroxy-6-metoxy-1,4-benzoquinol methylase